MLDTTPLSIDERKIVLEEREFELKKSESEARIINENKSSNLLNPITATILVALISFLGSSLSTYFQAKNSNDLEHQKFQSTLIMKALEQPAFEDRAKFLKFLTTLTLINDKDLSEKIDSFLTNQPQNIPYIPSSELSLTKNANLSSESLNKLREQEKVQKLINDKDFEGAIKLDPKNLIAYMGLIETQVKEGNYSKAVIYYNPLVDANKSGVGYSTYPYLILAFDQIGNSKQAQELIRQLRVRVNENIKEGVGYYSRSQQIRWLKSDLEKNVLQIKDSNIKDSLQNLIKDLNEIIVRLTS